MYLASGKECCCGAAMPPAPERGKGLWDVFLVPLVLLVCVWMRVCVAEE